MPLNRTVAFIVDDESVIASTLELILLSKGIDARSFVDPLEALEAARLVRPHLLMTDVVMPSMNGIDLAIQIRQLHPGCCVLLCSGQNVTGELLEKASLDGHHFEILPKPIHPNILLEKINELLAVMRPS